MDTDTSFLESSSSETESQHQDNGTRHAKTILITDEEIELSLNTDEEAELALDVVEVTTNEVQIISPELNADSWSAPTPAKDGSESDSSNDGGCEMKSRGNKDRVVDQEKKKRKEEKAKKMREQLEESRMDILQPSTMKKST